MKVRAPLLLNSESLQDPAHAFFLYKLKIVSYLGRIFGTISMEGSLGRVLGSRLKDPEFKTPVMLSIHCIRISFVSPVIFSSYHSNKSRSKYEHSKWCRMIIVLLTACITVITDHIFVLSQLNIITHTQLSTKPRWLIRKLLIIMFTLHARSRQFHL